MDERSIKKRLNRITFVVIIVSILILVGGGVASYYLRVVLGDMLDAQMESEAGQYKINIQRHIDGDFQTMDTLASFLRFGRMTEDEFRKGFLSSGEYNHFEYLGYFDTQKNGTVVSARDGDVRQMVADDLPGDVRSVIEGAWQGRSGISRISLHEDSGENVFYYAVPVYSARGIEGALVAGVNTDDTFAYILEAPSALRGKGYVHLISETGRILVKSKDRVVEEDLETIYDGDYIKQEEKDRIRLAMDRGDLCRSEFTYEGVTYQILLEPVGINGWYIFCVQTAKSVNADVYYLMASTRVVTAAVLLVLLGMIVYGYRMIYQSSKRLIQSAWYDPVTGAYNMARFEREVSGAIERNAQYSLAGLNVRQFKFINEIFGRRQADQLLRHIKDVLEKNLGEGECFCRSRDDMFYLFLRDTDRRVIRDRLTEIFSQIRSHSISNNRDYHILLYCGIVIGTEVADALPGIQKSLTHVSFALATARQSLKNSIWFYDTRLHEDEKLENYVESHMYQALEQEEFRMYLQPKMDLGTGKISGAEALVRWIPSSGKTIYPGQFIPIFERNGFCVNLDMYMAEKVCRQIRSWMDSGTEPIPISVNQSKLLFYEADYIDNMKALLDKYRIPANLVTLEILEGLAMENVQELNKKIVRLREVGFRISIDDFGSGYSSLNTLAGLQIDEVKFDRGFLAGAAEGGEEKQRQAIIVQEIISMAKKLEISTVMEGVETRENEELIRRLGCENAQGYYYSRPISAEEFTEKYL